MNLMRLFCSIIFLIFTVFLDFSYAQAEDPILPLEIHGITLTPSNGASEIQRELKLDLRLKPGFKAYVDKFKLIFLEPYPIKNSAIKLSPTHNFYDKFSKTNKIGIKESGQLSSLIEIQQPLSPGKQHLIFELKFQACSEKVCYFPQTIKQNFEFTVSSENKENIVDKPQVSMLEENFLSAQKRGLPYLFIFVFLAGVLTSLTPCLLPMLPLTIAVIGKGHSHDAKLKKFLNSLIYVMGIATTYSLLGVIAASSGALFGNILSNVWVQVGFGTAFVLMGLAQFGFFEFQTPLWLQNRFHKLGSGKGGIYITGLLSGLIASPCVGPVLVGILTFIAQSQNSLLGFWLMFAYALGLGQLLIILGTSSSLLYRFPRAPWIMKTSKTILGVTLIASGLFYLSLLWPKSETIQKGPIDTTESSPAQLQWHNYSEKTLEEAKKIGKPILIDFFAEWCLACHELEEKTFNNPSVKASLRGFTLLHFNATEESPELAILKKRYGIVGLPTLIFYNNRGQVLTEFTLNEFESSEKFIERLNLVKLK